MKKVHLIGNAHLDPVWLWDWREGLAEIKATFRSALDRMKEFPDFVFTSACAAYYMWIEKSDPAMFAEIVARVKEGRWCVTGGWLLQPDCNIPGGESFARHALISQRYFKEKFGKIARTGYNVDSFGHNAAIPMLLVESGMENYVFMRPQEHEKRLPSELFLWESADGSRVTTYRVPYRYCFDESCFHFFGDLAARYAPHAEMAFYGVGNHGGGPTHSLLTRMHAELDGRFIYSSPDTYFAEQSREGLPVVREDLQYHAKGCYSAESEVKENDRRGETALLTAERASVLSRALVGTPYPHSDMMRAWKKLLFLQFHDILGGCSIREAYADARRAHGGVISTADDVLNFACGQIAARINTRGNLGEGVVSAEDAERLGHPFVIYNLHARPIKTAVKLRLFGGCYQSATDAEGRAVRTQTVRDTKTDGNYNKNAMLVDVELPAFGYALYYAHKQGASAPETPLKVGENGMENAYLRVSFTEDGELAEIFDKRSGKNLLTAPTALRFVSCEGQDTWAHGVTHFDAEYTLPVEGSFHITEQGPVRATVRTEQRFGNSRIVRDYSLLAEGDSLEVRTAIDFREKFCILKFAFSCAGEASVTAAIPYGHIARPTDASEQVTGDWLALGALGVACEARHSFDAKENRLSVTTLRSGLYADHYGARDEFCEFSEQGEHFFSYSIFAYTTPADATHRAALLLAPPTALPESYHAGDLPTRYAGISPLPQEVAVTAIKPAEDGEGSVIRFFECNGETREFGFSLLGHEAVARVPHDGLLTLGIGEDGCQILNLLEWQKEKEN